MKQLNNKGSVLLIAILVLYLIIMISVNFFMVNTNEMNYARQYYHSSAAFWLAEAGANVYMSNPSMLDGQASAEIDYANGKVELTRDDSHPSFRYVDCIGTVGGIQREIQIAYPANVPEVFNNSISTNGNITVNGSKTAAIINGQTRISGEITGATANSNVSFDDAAQGVDSSLTSLSYVNSSGNNTDSDFVSNNRALIANYPPSQVLYLNNTESTTLTPEQVAGKTIVYVEGDGGGGNVTINTNALVQANQTLTVIATGTVTFNQSGNQAANSSLNIIAWGGYNETVSASSSYHGIIYTHGVADFDQIKADSVTNGSVIADGGIVLGDIWATKIFNYSNMLSNGTYPPGFETLIGGSTMGVALKPVSWREITL